jgi:hypothetical protein
MFKTILPALALLLMGQLALAQKPEAEIENFVKDFTRSFENVTKTRDKESVLKFVSKDLFSTIVQSNVMDNFGLIQSTYSDFENYLDRLIQTEGMAVTYSVQDVLKSKVRGKTGVVVAELKTQEASKGQVWNKGSEITTFVLKNYKDGWKILHFTVVSLEEEKTKGTCLVEIFSASTGNYAAKTIVPAGNTYNTHLNTFEFSPAQGMMFVRLDNDNTYSWMREGPITKLAQGNNPEKAMGSAVDETDAVLTIIKNDLYTESCLEFRKKR